jgi:hypothetical protein
MEPNKKQQDTPREDDKQKLADPKATEQMNELEAEADKERTRKPGSQSNSDSGRHNNGRGGGK